MGTRYQSKWENKFSWIQKADDGTEMAYCKLCEIKIFPQLVTLSNHEKSVKHKRITKSQIQIEDLICVNKQYVETDSREKNFKIVKRIDRNTIDKYQKAIDEIDNNMERKRKSEEECQKRKWKTSYEKNRKFQSKWEKKFTWVQKAMDGSEMAYCKSCNINILPKLCSLESHGKSGRHKLLCNLQNETEDLIYINGCYIKVLEKPQSTEEEYPENIEGYEEVMEDCQEVMDENEITMEEFQNVMEVQEILNESKNITDIDEKSIDYSQKRKWKPMYEKNRRYQSTWEEKFPWVQKASEHSEMPYCKLCHVEILPKLSNLLAHQKTVKHRLKYGTQKRMELEAAETMV